MARIMMKIRLSFRHTHAHKQCGSSWDGLFIGGECSSVIKTCNPNRRTDLNHLNDLDNQLVLVPVAVVAAAQKE